MNKRVVIVIVAALQVLTFAYAAKSDSYVELVRKANERPQAQDWPAAGALWEQVVEISPHVADSWLALGRAWVNAGEYRKAIPALEKARELGAGALPSNVTYEIARAPR